MAAVGALAAVLAAELPARADAAATPAPNLTVLKASLQAVVRAGSPGVFARVDDLHGTKVSTVSLGRGNIAAGTAVSPTGQFRVGSITKDFTAVLVLQLVGQKKVALDTVASKYLPAGVLPARSPITVRELLNHTSGLFDYTDDLLTGDTVTGYQKFRYRTYQPKTLVAMAVKHGSQFKPGSRYSYSNTNFVVLGLLVEKVTGLPYATALQRRILTPLGLTHTAFVVPKTTLPAAHAIGYLTQDVRSKPLFDATNQTASWLWSAGALISTTADLNRYLRALTTGKLLPAAQLTQMETMRAVDSTSGYGLGMRQYKLSCGISVYGHDGIIEGYQTYAYTTKDGSRQVTVSANASNNSAVFAAERRVLNPVFCGTAAPAAAQKLATADAGHVALEESGR
ncbi:serine hydrolase domain-containing protein [Streptacidiphilus sp. N1-3]|uniref:Serine hydrolase domain-containing protein n=1 Tax=Streptacidiphilus alkalitolerans TaxID=3342712 RepID=A0ABV6X0B6_9ACTN